MTTPRRFRACTPILLSLIFLSPAVAKYSGGTGEPNDPYQIATAADLIALGETPEDYDKHFILTADIDLDPNLPGRKVFDKAVIAPDTEPGTSGFQGTAFTGVFNGSGHTIQHLTITGGSYLGLFGTLRSTAIVSNLGLEAAEVSGTGDCVGGLVGSSDTVIVTSYSSGSVSAAGWYVGGLVGANWGAMTQCHSTAATSSTGMSVGGLVGDNWGTVSQCYSNGVVSGRGADYRADVGGLVGINQGSVTDCHSSNVVTGTAGRVGGLVGHNTTLLGLGGGGSLTRCYSSSTITGSCVGGLVGYNESGGVTQCYSTGTASGKYDIGGLVGENRARVAQCHSSTAVIGEDRVGGLVGTNRDKGTVIHCYSTGPVSGEESVGGLVGCNYTVVAECYSAGPVSGGSYVGGLVGFNALDQAVITQSYSVGRVDGTVNVGGLVGCNTTPKHPTSAQQVYGTVSGCFWDTQTSGQTTSAGGEGKMTAEVQTAETFLEAGWDFMGETKNGLADIWGIVEGKDYPRLFWQHWAFLPTPCNAATDILHGAVLSWHAPMTGEEHDVYFGEDETAVASAMTDSEGIYRGRQSRDLTTYDPGALECRATYYWRIDEVNAADPNSPWKGAVWSFTTADFIVVGVVDDFESYTDDEGKRARIYETWLDGYMGDPNRPGNGTGSFVGYMNPPFAEQKILHGGSQSMPMDYDNVSEPWYSEADRTWETPQDWTTDGADTLTLYFRGEVDNSPEPLYVGTEDIAGRIAVVVHADAEAVLATEWQKWHIALADVRAAGVDVAAVKKMVIGVGDRNNPQPGGTGRIYIDDIRLTKRMP